MREEVYESDRSVQSRGGPYSHAAVNRGNSRRYWRSGVIAAVFAAPRTARRRTATARGGRHRLHGHPAYGISLVANAGRMGS
jgi:hypothetical protein